MRTKKTYWAGYDLGGTKMLAAIYRDGFKELSREKKRTHPREGNERILDRILRTLREALDAAGVSPRQLAGIGMGCAAPLDLERGVVTDAPNLAWRNVPLRNAVARRFKCPVTLANDVDAGLYGEYVAGAAQGARCAVGIFPGTGIGGACVYAGQLVRGRTHSCMEIGHLPVIPGGQRCGCGAFGCLETVASRLAIAGAAAQAVARGEAPHLEKLAGTDLANLRSGTLAAAIKAGDEAIEQIVRQAARWTGIAAGYCVNLLAPDVIVIGGGLAEAMPRIYREEVTAAALRTCMPTYRKSFQVRLATLGDDAIVRGAAALAAAAHGRQGEPR